MKKLLMLSASVFEIPLIRAAQAQGYYVITTGNNAKAPGHKVSDEYAPFDYSDYEGMVALAKRLQIDAISQGCSDNCALVAAYMGEKLQMKGHDTFENAKIIHRKDDFKRFAKKIQLKTPIATDFSDINEAKAYDFRDKYPLIVKPSDQAGGNGVSVVYSREEYLEAVEKAFGMSRDGKIVVEPYIHGTVHSFSTFIVNGKVATYATLNDYSYANKYMTNTGISPADNHVDAVPKLIPEVEKVVRELKLVDGLLHMQYIDSDGDYWIIEMMRRMPGNNCTTAATRAFGIDWRDWIVRAEAGLDCSGIPTPRTPEKIYGYHAIMSDHNGIYQGTVIDEEIKPYIIDYVEYDEPGEVVDDYLHQKFGLVQMYFNNDEEKERYIHRIDELIQCVVSEE
ncbi:MAG: ATP-grasp domain-containing protein [Agathobacter sp.]|uniref:ATP-grasp domain-containing protein n=1 Tax=Agathobacter sp. TaxID=2021311 RepID=UPI00258D6346|nr:ATP-grasp domain-containing protein [Agathobacter sp.]MCR5678134.1 ATP-grasp domain-containing protein [Agathobacter sp.]